MKWLLDGHLDLASWIWDLELWNRFHHHQLHLLLQWNHHINCTYHLQASLHFQPRISIPRSLLLIPFSINYEIVRETFIGWLQFILLHCNNQSTASFFQDKSVSLAQLLGFRTDERGRLYFPKSLRFEERNMILENGSCSNGTKVQEKDVAKVICIPVLLDALLKIIKSKKSSRN